MTTHEMTQRACGRFEELELKAASGKALTTDEQGFKRRHKAECDTCGLMEEATRAIRYAPPDVPCQPEDELTVHRTINQAIDRASRSVAEDGDAAERTRLWPTTLWQRRRLLWIAGAVAAMVLLAISVMFFSASGTLLYPDRRPVADAPGSTALGRVTLVSGSVETSRGSVALGQTMRPGEQIRVAKGQAALVFRSGTSILLGPQTTVALPDSASKPMELRLVTGEIVAVVVSDRRSPTLAVRVSTGLVTVIGTIFSVRYAAGKAEVSVLGGVVRVADPGQAPRQVTHGRKYTFGKGIISALPRKKERALLRRVNILSLLQGDRPARLSLRSEPPGARVAVDGTSLGATPLDAALKAGHRKLELRLVGHVPVLEFVLFRPGMAFSRDLDLRREKPPASNRSRRAGPLPIITTLTSDEGWKRILRLARKRRRARDWRGAAKAYMELIRRYPRQGASRASLITLGFIQLEHLGKPRSALANFRRYLRGSGRGALVREAAWGRTLALGALGRRRAELRALRRFMKRYPRSVYHRRAKSRLKQLTGTPNVMGSKPR